MLLLLLLAARYLYARDAVSTISSFSRHRHHFRPPRHRGERAGPVTLPDLRRGALVETDEGHDLQHARRLLGEGRAPRARPVRVSEGLAGQVL